MILDYFTLTIAFVISTVSAFYSITGLTAIFAAAYWPIVIMGSVLELGKVVTAMWLRRNWRASGWMIRGYLMICVAILMMITNMGTYGFLSKAHLDQAGPVQEIQAQVAIINSEIQEQQRLADANKQQLAMLDQAVTQNLARTQDQQGVERTIQIRRTQQSERTRIRNEDQQIQATISKLRTQRQPLDTKLRSMELEVGPIKYISALIPGVAQGEAGLESAVRFVIVLLVLVFDPLALALVLAVNQKLDRERGKNPVTPRHTPEPTELPTSVISPVNKPQRGRRRKSTKLPVETPPVAQTQQAETALTVQTDTPESSKPQAVSKPRRGRPRRQPEVTLESQVVEPAEQITVDEPSDASPSPEPQTTAITEPDWNTARVVSEPETEPAERETSAGSRKSRRGRKPKKTQVASTNNLLPASLEATPVTISIQELVAQVTSGKLRMEQLTPQQKQKVRQYLSRERVLGK